MKKSTQNNDFGLIGACEKHTAQCQYKCCDFADNYILLYPGEYEQAKLKKDHLKIIDKDYLGGKKAICNGICKEGDLKPLDCKSYPYFPRINEKDELEVLKGNKCPLAEEELAEHKKKFMQIWKELLKDEAIFEWAKKSKEVGYELV